MTKRPSGLAGIVEEFLHVLANGVGGLVRLEEAAIAIQNLVRAIVGHVAECLVHRDQRHILRFRVREAQRNAAFGESAAQTRRKFGAGEEGIHCAIT